MSALDELKKNWSEGTDRLAVPVRFDQQSFDKVIKQRVKTQTGKAFQYFWSAFVLQLLVYALLSHVLVKYWSDPEISWVAIGCILLFVPFTTLLMRKFKAIANENLAGTTAGTLRQHIQNRYYLLLSFYRFKKRYEWVLVPISSTVGVFIVFKLYVPGGVALHWTGAFITLFITLLSCMMAIRSENKQKFEQPLAQLRSVLNEFPEVTENGSLAPRS